MLKVILNLFTKFQEFLKPVEIIFLLHFANFSLVTRKLNIYKFLFFIIAQNKFKSFLEVFVHQKLLKLKLIIAT